MFIVDSRIHICEPERPDRPWTSYVRSLGHRLDNPRRGGRGAQLDGRGGRRRRRRDPAVVGGDWNFAVSVAVAAHPTRFAAMGRVGLDTLRSAQWRELSSSYDGLASWNARHPDPAPQLPH